MSGVAVKGVSPIAVVALLSFGGGAWAQTSVTYGRAPALVRRLRAERDRRAGARGDRASLV
jgi:hypothetical protein